MLEQILSAAAAVVAFPAAADGSVMHRLFGDLPSTALPAVSYSVAPSRTTVGMTAATAATARAGAPTSSFASAAAK